MRITLTIREGISLPNFYPRKYIVFLGQLNNDIYELAQKFDRSRKNIVNSPMDQTRIDKLQSTFLFFYTFTQKTDDLIA